MTDTQKKVKIGKDKQDTLPKGAIPAYEAEDGSLHREEIDRDICNARIEYGLAMKAAGELMANNAPYVDDWECRAAA